MIGNGTSFYYDQIRLGVPVLAEPILRLEFDFESRGLIGSDANFTVLFDTPTVRKINFDNEGRIRLEAWGPQGLINSTIGNFNDGESSHISIVIDHETDDWSIYQDYDLIGGGTVSIDERIQSIRLSFGLISSVGTPDASAVAIDNLVLSNIPEPANAAVLVSLITFAMCATKRRKPGRIASATAPYPMADVAF